MDTFLKADIFFFVTTIAVVLLTTLLATALVYLIGVLKNVRESSEIVKATINQLSQNIAGAQDSVDSFLQKLNVVQFIRSAFGSKRKNAKNKTNEDYGTKE